MLDELQKAKLVAWAEWCLTHDGFLDTMPRGLRAVAMWTQLAFDLPISPPPFPTFDRDEPYTFGEDHG